MLSDQLKSFVPSGRVCVLYLQHGYKDGSSVVAWEQTCRHSTGATRTVLQYRYRSPNARG